MNLATYEWSDTARKLHIDNSIPENLLDNAERTIRFFNDLESRFPHLTVTSGYRCKKLNEIVGGRPKSDHLVALAFDFFPNQLNRAGWLEIIDYLRSHKDVRFVQPTSRYIHVSLNPF